MIKKNGGYYPIKIDTYHIHVFCLDYDAKLPQYYNNNHSFLWKNMDKQLLNDSKYFEKIEINWFSIPQMKMRKSEFRNFYRDILDVLFEHEKQIIEFLMEGNIVKVSNKTRKKR